MWRFRTTCSPGTPKAFSCHAEGDLKLNPHLHGVFLDGVFVEGQGGEQDGEQGEQGGELIWHSLPKLHDQEVADTRAGVAPIVPPLTSFPSLV